MFLVPIDADLILDVQNGVRYSRDAGVVTIWFIQANHTETVTGQPAQSLWDWLEKASFIQHPI